MMSRRLTSKTELLSALLSRRSSSARLVIESTSPSSRFVGRGEHCGRLPLERAERLLGHFRSRSTLSIRLSMSARSSPRRGQAGQRALAVELQPVLHCSAVLSGSAFWAWMCSRDHEPAAWARRSSARRSPASLGSSRHSSATGRRRSCGWCRSGQRDSSAVRAEMGADRLVERGFEGAPALALRAARRDRRTLRPTAIR